MFLLNALILAIFFFVVYLLAEAAKNHGIVDLAWGLSFVLQALLAFFRAPSRGPQSLLLVLLVLVWGIRLSLHLGHRNLGKPEDYRYQAMREGPHGGRWRIRRAYIFQYLMSLLIAAPFIWRLYKGAATLHGPQLLGAFWALTAFLYETRADFELKAYLSQGAQRAPLLKTGLFRWHRHPNYFGEAMFWWGLALLAMGGFQDLWFFYSPLLMSLLLCKVTGIPLKEKRMQEKEAWAAYAQETPAFWPQFFRIKK